MSDIDPVTAGRRVLTTEARALDQQAADLGEDFARAVETVFAAKGRVVCTGIGKSGHVARKIAATLASTGTPAMFVHAAEASHGDLGMFGDGDVVLALSKSGEVRELSDIIAYCHRFALPLLGMTANPASALGAASTIVLKLADAPEATGELNAPTTSTTLQIALGDALAVALLERRGFTPKDFHVFHPGGKLGAMLRTVGDLMHKLAEAPLAGLDMPMPQAMEVMTARRLGVVGVVDAEGRLAGVVTDGDLRRNFAGLSNKTVEQVMSRNPKAVTAQTLAADAARIMNESRITVLFVVDDGRPVGVLHVHDVLSAGVV
ncbi:MAG: KpsF/GutQ family sugar-phosphate isomerase [Caulobacteraceae bacterium]|nr:MAG: KpsF/GutQ family sugar-phosphate isomerase [Caulobacteraceae bacterium]